MKHRVYVIVAAATFASSMALAAEESVATARELYAAAAYEDALLLLNRLRSAPRTGDDSGAIEQYRAFCLLALGRRDDAEQAIAAVVVGEPTFRPSDGEVSPRVRAAFSEVRRRMLPTITQERYTLAKAAYDRKDFPTAAQGFKQVLDLLNDPDMGGAGSQPPLSDLRTLATGFHDLSAKASAPPVEPPPAALSQPIATPRPPQGPVRGRIYGSEDGEVTPPVAIRQSLPAFQLQGGVPPAQGVLEIVIGESGNVEAAAMRSSVHPKYDSTVIAAARTWKYKPATVQGVPVLYRKLVAINVKRNQ